MKIFQNVHHNFAEDSSELGKLLKVEFQAALRRNKKLEECFQVFHMLIGGSQEEQKAFGERFKKCCNYLKLYNL